MKCRQETKNNLLRDCLFRWIRLGQTGITMEKLLEARGYNKIAIYGYDKIAECLVYELRNSQIELKCIIDKKGKNISTDFPGVVIEEAKGMDFDAVIVCPVNNYEIIKEQIKQSIGLPVITFEELIYEL